MKTRYAIGIDPGTQTGIALWDREERRFEKLATMGFWDAREFCLQFPDAEFFVETPQLKRIYARHDAEQGGRRRERMATNMGGNMREADLFAEGLEREGLTVRRVRPTAQKWTAEEFARHAGITARTNQHVRDAARMVLGT